MHTKACTQKSCKHTCPGFHLVTPLVLSPLSNHFLSQTFGLNVEHLLFLYFSSFLTIHSHNVNSRQMSIAHYCPCLNSNEASIMLLYVQQTRVGNWKSEATNDASKFLSRSSMVGLKCITVCSVVIVSFIIIIFTSTNSVAIGKIINAVIDSIMTFVIGSTSNFG